MFPSGTKYITRISFDQTSFSDLFSRDLEGAELLSQVTVEDEEEGEEEEGEGEEEESEGEQGEGEQEEEESRGDDLSHLSEVY